jgi:hypothetical protein
MSMRAIARSTTSSSSFLKAPEKSASWSSSVIDVSEKKIHRSIIFGVASPVTAVTAHEAYHFGAILNARG